MVAFALAIALPLGILASVTTGWYVVAERARLASTGQMTGNHIRERLDRDLSEMIATTKTLATSPSIDAGDWTRFDAQGRALVDTSVVTVVLSRLDGRHIVNTRVPLGGPMPTVLRPEIVKGLTDGRGPFVSPVMTSALTGAEIVMINAPVVRGHAAEMFVAVAVRTDHFARLIARTDIGDPFTAILVDGNGRIVAETGAAAASSDASSTDTPPPSSVPRTLRDWEASGAGSMEFVHRSGVSGWSVVTRLEKGAFEAPLYQSLAVLAVLALILVGGGGTVAWIYARQMTRVVGTLTGAAEAIGRGDLVDVPVTSIREANRIGTALSTASRISAEQRAGIAQANALLEVRVAERGRELEASRAHYQILAEAMTDVVILRHADWRIAYVSPSGRGLFGTDSPGLDPRTRIDPGDLEAFVAADEQLGPDRPSVVSLFRMRHADGRLIWIEAVNDILACAAPGEPNVISTLRDVTARQDQADELRMARDAAELAQAKAENASRAKSAFMGLMSHEIRTPLTTIKGFADLLARTGGLSLEQSRYLELVGSATDTLIGAVDDVLDYAKAEAGDLHLDHLPLDLPALVHEAADLVRPAAEGRGLSVTVTLAVEPTDRPRPGYVLGDARRLRQVLLNLLNDAVGTLHRGSVGLVLQGPKAGEPVGRWRVAVVAEAGDDDPERPFPRATALDGSGLGFIIAQRLVGLMGGGRIDRSTPLGEMAAYRFSLSLAPAPEAAMSLAAPDEAERGGGRILVVEDSPINQEVVQAMLRRLGYGVDLVDSGEAAILAVQATTYDLVLMDVSMPGIDGITAVRRIRTLQHPARRVPILSMSANAMSDRIRALDEAGVDGHLGKPFDLPTLSHAVARQLSALVLRETDASRLPLERPTIFDRAVFDGLSAAIGDEAAREAVRALVALLERHGDEPDEAAALAIAAEAERTGFRDLAGAYRGLAALSAGGTRGSSATRCRIARDLMVRMVGEIVGPAQPELRRTIAIL